MPFFGTHILNAAAVVKTKYQHRSSFFKELSKQLTLQGYSHVLLIQAIVEQYNIGE